jgi:hypothetical protein
MTRLLSAEAVVVSRAACQARLPKDSVAIAQGVHGDLLFFRSFGGRPIRIYLWKDTLWQFIADSGDVVRAFDSLDECLQEYAHARYEPDE